MQFLAGKSIFQISFRVASGLNIRLVLWLFGDQLEELVNDSNALSEGKIK